MTTPATIDRLPPHSPECEMGVLGCIMLSPNDCMAEIIDKFQSNPEVFYDLRHQTIFWELVKMYDEQVAIDVINLQQRLNNKQVLEQVGGIGYLASLPDAVPSAANWSYYAEFVVDKYLLRKMIQVGSDVVASVYANEGEVNELLDDVEQKVLSIREALARRATPGMKDLIKRAITTIEECHARKGGLSGLGTGFTDFDRMTDGLQPGDMIVLAARPSMGKSSLAMNIVEHVAVDLKLPVGVFSLEMTADSLALRLLCSRARVNLRNIRDGYMAERDFPKLTGASAKLSTAPIFIDDSSGLSIIQLRAKARRMAQQHGIKLLAVDYLQLLHSTSRKAQNRQQEIGDISHGLKALAKELGIPVIVLAQLNRELEKDKNRKPRMSDLRESGDVEQDADVVGLLYRPASDDDEQQAEDAFPVNLLIAKQRNGPTGEVNLTFLKSFTRFEAAARVSDADIPQ